ncbi:MAG: GAF domain-containing protein, partial [Thermotogaceae bacterium]|nr:GAF domain-containing protein [Thermotogaceae bacterium]
MSNMDGYEPGKTEKNFRHEIEEKNNSEIVAGTDIGFMVGKILFDEKGKPYDFQILKVNSAFEKLMGLKANEVVGNSGRKVFPNIEPYWIDLFGKVAITGDRVEASEYFGTFNKYFKIDIFSTGENIFIAAFTDITDIKEQQNKLNKLYQLQQLMNVVRTGLIEADNENELYHKVCSTLVDDLVKIAGIVLVGVSLEQDKSSHFEIAAIAVADEYKDLNINTDLFLNPLANNIFQTTLETGKCIVINDKTKDNGVVQYKNNILKLNLKSALILPLIHEDEKIGVMALYSDQEASFDEETILLLKGLSTDVAIRVQMIRLREILKENNEQLQKAIGDILNVTSRIVESKDPYTAGHQKRVAQLSVAIAKELGLPGDKVKMIELAALVHDVG